MILEIYKTTLREFEHILYLIQLSLSNWLPMTALECNGGSFKYREMINVKNFVRPENK